MDVQSTLLLKERRHIYEILLAFPEITVGEWNEGDQAVFRN